MTSGLYHVNEEGNPGKCSAKSGNCPFGGEDSHFTSPEAARHSYEEKQSKKEDAVKSWKRKPVNKPNPEPDYSGHGAPRSGHGMPVGHGFPYTPPAPKTRKVTAPKAPAPKISRPKSSPSNPDYSTGHGRSTGHGYSTGHGGY